jgi:hypothetical protein
MNDQSPDARHSAVEHPLLLAGLYQAGYGHQWRSYREASNRLTAFNMKIGYARIQEALAISKLPAPILRLFDNVGLVNRTARQLLQATRECGIEAVVARAEKLDATGMSRTQILSVLRGDEVRGSTYRTGAVQRPIVLAELYEEWLRNSRWTTPRSAGNELGISQSRIVEARQIAGLPEEVKALFSGAALTRALGMQLVRLTSLRGSGEVRQLAIQSGHHHSAPLTPGGA